VASALRIDPPDKTEQDPPVEQEAKEPSFYHLLRNSNFVKLGSLKRAPKTVVGKIVRRIDGDLYIEFGGKFKTVCKLPRTKSYLYVVGTEVLVALHDLEMTSRYLGAVRDITLLEADATLIGLAPVKDAPVQEESEPIDLVSMMNVDDHLDSLFVTKIEKKEDLDTETERTQGQDHLDDLDHFGHLEIKVTPIKPE